MRKRRRLLAFLISICMVLPLLFNQNLLIVRATEPDSGLSGSTQAITNLSVSSGSFAVNGMANIQFDVSLGESESLTGIGREQPRNKGHSKQTVFDIIPNQVT